MSRRGTTGLARILARVVVPLLLGLTGCGGDSPGTPSVPVAPIEGAYSLRVEASPFCSDLPVATFDFSVTASRAPSGSGWRIESINEFGFSEIRFDFAPGTSSAGSVTGRLEITFATVELPPELDFGGDLNGLFNASGQVTTTGGRGEVQRGTLVGTLELSWSSAGVSHRARCTDAQHGWSLTAR
jgi:hypothetical protein